jgi:thiol:disulfide interchange protein DsbD
MYKIVLIAILSFASLLANKFLEPQQAFIVTTNLSDKGLSVDLKLADKIYVYDEMIKFTIMPSGKNITKLIDIPKPINHDGSLIHYSFDLMIDKSILGDSSSVIFEYQGCSEAGLCYSPLSKTIKLNSSKIAKTTELNETDKIASAFTQGSLLTILAMFFVFGLALSLTPCVFPMIPILSSILVKASGNNGGKMSASKGFMLSLVYVLSMSVAYTFAGVLAGLFGSNLQALLQTPLVLTIFALIFVALAFSMFGYFSLELPKSWQNKLNATTDGKEKDGVLGIAIMGFLSALIVGPCVAPPLAGALVYIGQSGDALLGGLALFVLSMGMGVPLLLLGLGAGRFMPKAGGWMNRVSEIFGIVMLFIAIWMLERIIPPMVTLVLISLLFMGTSIYLYTYRSIVGKAFAIVSFVIGYIYALDAGSGSTNMFAPLDYLNNKKVIESKSQFQRVKTLSELKQIVKNSNKPVMLDFYADWCISCKEMEHDTFANPDVRFKMGQFLLLQVDVTNNSREDKELLGEFGLFGPPGIIFWDKNGKELTSAQLVGFKSPDAFLEHINKYFKN